MFKILNARDKGLVFTTWFITIWLRCFIPTVLVSVALFINGVIGFTSLLMGPPIVSLLTTIVVLYVTSSIGTSCSNTLFGFGGKPTIREQLAGDMDKAMYFYQQEDYEKAREIIAYVLEVDPDFSEALLIRAKIEIKTEQIKAAKATLREILSITNSTKTTRRWASSLLHDLINTQI